MGQEGVVCRRDVITCNELSSIGPVLLALLVNCNVDCDQIIDDLLIAVLEGESRKEVLPLVISLRLKVPVHFVFLFVGLRHDTMLRAKHKKDGL